MGKSRPTAKQSKKLPRSIRNRRSGLLTKGLLHDNAFPQLSCSKQGRADGNGSVGGIGPSTALSGSEIKVIFER